MMSSQWEAVLQLADDDLLKLRDFYNGKIPLEVRGRFSKWLEERPWSEIDENNESHGIENALPLLKQLIEMAQAEAKVFASFRDFANVLQDQYLTAPLKFVRDLKECLAFERELLSNYSNIDSPMSSVEEYDGVMLNQLTEDYKAVNSYHLEISKEVEALEKNEQEFVLTVKELGLIDAYLNRQEEELEERRLNVQRSAETQVLPDEIMIEIGEIAEKTNEMNKNRKLVKQNLFNFIVTIQKLQNNIVQLISRSLDQHGELMTSLITSDIPEWKHKQQIACNGGNPPDIMLILKRCIMLSESLKRIQHSAEKFKEMVISQKLIQNKDAKEGVERILQRLQKLLVTLVCRSTIVDQQPPQVLRKDTNFETSILIPAGKAVYTQHNIHKAKVYIIDETQATLVRADQEPATTNYLLNNEVTVDIRPDGSLCAKFKNLKLKDFKRDTKKSKQRISEEKYCLLFECKATVGENYLPIRVTSVPVIITTHVSQDCQSLGCIAWDHQFAEKDRLGFEVPTSVAWDSLAKLLNVRFKHETGRELGHHQLKYLCTKLIGHRDFDTLGNQPVSYEDFCKKPLPESHLMFWDWFYHIMKLTKDHLHGLWNDGVISGFVWKPDVDVALDQCDIGNFIIRFSDNTLGGVSIAGKEKGAVFHCEPLTGKDFQVQKFPHILKGFKALTHFYPDKPKDEVLRKYLVDEKESVQMSPYRSFIWKIQMSYTEDEPQEETTENCEELLSRFIEEFGQESMMIDN